MGSQHASAGSSLVTKITWWGCWWWGRLWGSIWSSLPSAQFCCEYKTSLKGKDYWGNKGMLGSVVTVTTLCPVRHGVHSGPQTGPHSDSGPVSLSPRPRGNKALTSPNPDCQLNLDNVTWNQHWIFIWRNGAEGESPIIWPPDVKSHLIRKDPDTGKDWRQKEKEVAEDEMVG